MTASRSACCIDRDDLLPVCSLRPLGARFETEAWASGQVVGRDRLEVRV